MSEPINFAVRFLGKYAGEGRWTDITGESKRYKVSQEILAQPVGLLVKYNHNFIEEGTATEGEFLFETVSELIFTTKMKGAAVGNGYLLDDYLHFNIKVGEIFVETSYQLQGNGLRVRGSSTSNSQGRFIAWSEAFTLIR